MQEALATIAMNHFYSGQAEVALHFYKRLLEIGHSLPSFAYMSLCTHCA